MPLHRSPDEGWCSRLPQGVRLTVQITPNAKKNEVIGVLGDVLKIKLQAPPIEGKANEALIRYLADALGIAKSAVRITQGHTSRRKLIDITAPDLTVEHVKQTFIPSSSK
jgi:uncharacterized protein